MATFTNRPIKPNTIKELRRFIKNKRSPQLYLMLAAIRGPDIGAESEYKIITRAIRAYIGFDENRNCSGNTSFGLNELKRKILEVEKKERENLLPHYLSHLYYALQSIDKQKLIAWAEKNWQKY